MVSPDVNNHRNKCGGINVVYVGDFAQLEPVRRCSVGNSLEEEEDMEDREKEDPEEQVAKRMLDYLLPYVAS